MSLLMWSVFYTSFYQSKSLPSSTFIPVNEHGTEALGVKFMAGSGNRKDFVLKLPF